MFDLTSLKSLKNTRTWLQDVIRVVGPDIPIVLCGSKVDVKNKSVTTLQKEQFFQQLKALLPQVVYYDISSKSNYNFDKPFLKISKQLTGQGDLEFSEAPFPLN